jgi:hypothetical protein
MTDKAYNIRISGQDKKSLSVCFPPEFIASFIKRKGITTDELKRKYQAVASYNETEDYVMYTFKER